MFDIPRVLDFSSDIANHTLEQVPNALYQGKPRKTRRKAFPSSRQLQGSTAPGGNDSTDSEELDHSDSGYSSPMHRKNQMSSGTDARTRSSELSHTVLTNNNAQRSGLQNPPATYTSTQSAHTGLYHAVSLHDETVTLGLISQSPTSYASALATSHQTRRANSSVPTSKPAQTKLSAQLSTGASISDCVNATTESSSTTGTKKKRKRGRRKRRKGRFTRRSSVSLGNLFWSIGGVGSRLQC